MHPQQDKLTFATEMKRLSTALSIELSDDRLTVYWDALCDLPIDGVAFACQHAARYWRPTVEERRFPVPLTLREYAKTYREQQMQQVLQDTRRQLAMRSENTDAVGMQALQAIFRMLGDSLEMKHPVYQEPSTDNPEKRRAELREQVRHIINHDPDHEDPIHD